MNKYFIYARKSSEAEDRQVLSIDSQLRELRELARKEKLTIVKEFTESKTSKKPGRKVFNEMLVDIESGIADGIIAWHPDRLARNSIDGGKILFLIDTGMVKALKFPTFRFDNTAYGKFMLNIAFGQSKYYIDNLSENVKRGFREKVSRGEFPGWAPLGYQNNLRDHTIILDNEKAPLIKKLFELYSTGDYSIRKIRTIANDIELRSKFNNVPSKSMIAAILHNPFYYGVFKLNGEIFEGSHPPIISKRLFDKVQRIFDIRAKPTRKAHYNFAFRGYMKCGECGAMITAEHKKGKYIYYHCTKRKTKCSQGCIEEKELTQQIKTALIPICLNDKTKNKIFAEFEKHKTNEESTIGTKIIKSKKELSNITEQTDKLLDAYLSNIIDEKEYQTKKRTLVEQKTDLKQNLADLQTGYSEWFELSKSVINTCNSVEKIIKGKNLDDLSKILQKTGSNFVLRDKKVSFDFQKPFDFISLKNSIVLDSFKKKGALSISAESAFEKFFKNVNNSLLNENWL